MVAPQVSGDDNGDEFTWKIIKSRRTIKEQRKSNYNKNFPPLQSVTTKLTPNGRDNMDDSGSRLSQSSSTHKTPTKKPFIKLRRVSPDIDDIKIVQVPTKMKKNDEDDMLTVSSSSHEGYFSSSSKDTRKN